MENIKITNIEIINKENAIGIGQKWYFTGIPCKNDHLNKRYVNTGICYECKQKNMILDHLRHNIRNRKIQKKCYEKDPSKSHKKSQKWAETNREKSNNIKKLHKIKYREKYLKREKEYEKNKRKNPSYRLSSAISRQIWGFLKGKKSGRKWETFIDYTFDELKKHIEIKLTEEMSWSNYGSIWEIDHVTPKSWFKNTEEDVKKAWALENLQPKLKAHNRSKGNRFKG